MKLPRRWSSALLAGAIAAVSACGDASPVGVEFPAPSVDAHAVAPAAPAFQLGSPSLSGVANAQTLGPTGGPLMAGEDLLAQASGTSTRLSAGRAAASNAGTLFRRTSNGSYRSNYAVAW